MSVASMWKVGSEAGGQTLTASPVMKACPEALSWMIVFGASGEFCEDEFGYGLSDTSTGCFV